MSHKATNWAIEQRGLKPATKIVLWHLADCHNPSLGCFPSQVYLADRCEMSRSSINTHLNTLEEAGLIHRKQVVDQSGRQMPTQYLLVGIDAFPRSSQDAEPCPETGHGAVSRKQAEPCPENRRNRVQNLDTNPVKEPVNQPVTGGGGFQRIWQECPTSDLPDDKEAANRIFEKLSAADQRKAVDAFPIYAAAMARRGKRVYMIQFFKKKLFETYHNAQIDDRGEFVCRPGMAEWEAWKDWVRERHGRRGLDNMERWGYFATNVRWPEAKQ